MSCATLKPDLWQFSVSAPPTPGTNDRLWLGPCSCPSTRALCPGDACASCAPDDLELLDPLGPGCLGTWGGRLFTLDPKALGEAETWGARGSGTSTGFLEAGFHGQG